MCGGRSKFSTRIKGCAIAEQPSLIVSNYLLVRLLINLEHFHINRIERTRGREYSECL